jgi:hypothetical protein
LLPATHQVIIADPDFVFLAPMPLNVSVDTPASSKYALNVHSVLPGGEMYKYCGSACDKVSWETLDKYYNVGPPYVMTVAQLRMLAPAWWNLTRTATLDTVDPTVDMSNPGGYLMDMYTYIIAAVQLDLPHRLAHLMISDGKWQNEWVLLQDVSPDFVPPVLHYCQRYVVHSEFGGKKLELSWMKHDFHEETKQPLSVSSLNNRGVILSCNPAVADSIWQHGADGPSPLPEHPRPVITPEMTAPTETSEVTEQRMKWILWHLRSGFKDAVRMYRRKLCSSGS